jgi:predicted membrane metal-binding protein
LGFAIGGVFALSSFERKWEEIQRVSYEPSFFYARCADFKRGSLVAPQSMTTEIRLPRLCPDGWGFLGFGRLVPKEDFSWAMKPSDRLIWRPAQISGLYGLRAPLSERLSNEWPLQSGLRRAFLIGDGSELSGSIWRTMNTLGLSHLLVASGMHLTISAEIVKRMLSFLLRWTARPSSFSLLTYRVTLFSLISLYSFLLGFDVSVARAWWVWVFTQALSFLHPLGLRLKGVGALAMAGVVLALLDPLAVFDVSYALSFVTSWFILQTGSVILTSFAAVLTCSVLGLPTTLLSVVVNGLLAGPLFSILIPLGFVPLFCGRLSSVCEKMITNTFGFLRLISAHLPQVGISPGVSAAFLAAIVGLCLVWGAKQPNFKVYFDNPRLVSLTLRVSGQLKRLLF